MEDEKAQVLREVGEAFYNNELPVFVNLTWYLSTKVEFVLSTTIKYSHINEIAAKTKFK